MGLVSKFKAVCVTSGIVMSSLGGLGIAGAVNEAHARQAAGTQTHASYKESEFAVAAGGMFFFAGTTLIATGWRPGRQKKYSWQR